MPYRDSEVKHFMPLCDDFTVETAYFTIAHDNSNINIVKELFTHSDNVLEQLLEIYGLTSQEEILIFLSSKLSVDNRKPYIVYGVEYVEMLNESRGIAWSSGLHVVLTNAEGVGITALIHELSHFVFEPDIFNKGGMSELDTKMPLFPNYNSLIRAFNEGIAQIFEHHEVESDRRITFKYFDEKYTDYQKNYTASVKDQLREVELESIYSVSKEHRGTKWTHETYLASESLILYMIDVYGIDALSRFLSTVNFGYFELGISLEKACGVNPREFQEGWLTWVRS